MEDVNYETWTMRKRREQLIWINRIYMITERWKEITTDGPDNTDEEKRVLTTKYAKYAKRKDAKFSVCG
jgi:hypothetical protein